MPTPSVIFATDVGLYTMLMSERQGVLLKLEGKSIGRYNCVFLLMYN